MWRACGGVGWSASGSDVVVPAEQLVAEDQARVTRTRSVRECGLQALLSALVLSPWVFQEHTTPARPEEWFLYGGWIYIPPG